MRTKKLKSNPMIRLGVTGNGHNVSLVISQHRTAVVTVDMANGVALFNTSGNKTIQNYNTIQNFLRATGMPHTISRRGDEWWVEMPKNRSTKWFDGIKFGMSARQWLELYRMVRVECDSSWRLGDLFEQKPEPEAVDLPF
jgi:hypothetical protein